MSARSGIWRACIFITALLALACWWSLPKPPLLDGIDFSQRVRDRQGRSLKVTLTSDDKYRMWTPLDQIAPELIDATIRYEDRFFWRHPGVNAVALARATFRFTKGDARAGASTITMQLARLRFQLRTKTVRGKLEQIIRALAIERHYSKRKILEAYLNLAPYGGNIEGIGAASEIHFGKSAAHLSNPEALSLSVIPQSPARRRPSFHAVREPRAQFVAPHFVRRVLEEPPAGQEIITTLDLPIQGTVESRIARYIAENRARGVANASALLIDSETMEVLAHVGSAEFENAEIQGQVDGTRSPRSPGSTLKPFVYALALDQGLIHPLSIVKDAPRNFAGYNPENFDRDFLGPIRAADALARSRNVPAVALAAELSRPGLYDFLADAGVEFARPEAAYGLSLPLGGAEVTMENLVRLYAMLANGGVLHPLRRVPERSIGRGKRMLSAEAAFLTLDMLSRSARPGVAGPAAGGPISWKTGTSHGFRDAWSVAVFDRYVLAVWIGNFDGRPSAAFVGRSCAAPLLFQIIDSLRAQHRVSSRRKADVHDLNLKRVQFCAVSGQLPTSSCSHRSEGWFIPGVSPIRECDVHREVLVEVASGLRVAADDGTRPLRREVYEFWPSDLLALFQLAGVPRRIPPPFVPGTANEMLARAGRKPRLILSGDEIILGEGLGLPLRAETDADVRRIYWFADKTFLGASNPKAALAWKPAAGTYQLTALDDHGRSACATINVR
jgi:penicillin-binding protein 1C